MKRHLKRIILTALLSMTASTLAFADDQEINILNWAQYMPPDLIKQFYAETGIRLHQTYFSDGEMLKGMLMAGNSGYDLAVPALVEMDQEIKAGLFYPLDKAQIPNFKNVNPALYKITAEIDPGNRYGIIYTYGTTGIAYNVKLVKQILGTDTVPDSWDLLLSPKYLKKLSRCGVAFLDGPTQVFGITLFYLGLNPNSKNPKDYEKAANYLMTIRPYLTYFDNNLYIPDLASGNICLAMGYSGDVYRAMKTAKESHDGVDIRYFVPKAGGPIWFDMMAIPKHAEHPELAMKFLNFLLEPKVMAEVSNFLGQPNAVPASNPYLIPELSTLPFAPDEAQTKTLFSVHNPSMAMNAIVNRYWFEVRYGIKLNS